MLETMTTQAESTVDGPLLVFYDRSCPLCETEMQTLRKADQRNRLQLIDCSAADFSHPTAEQAKISRQRLLEAMHVLDASGRWHVGVDAFVEVYSAVGIHRVARWLSKPWLKPLFELIYPLIARYRQPLSRLGLNRPFERMIQREARRAAGRHCSTTDCSLEEH